MAWSARICRNIFFLLAGSVISPAAPALCAGTAAQDAVPAFPQAIPAHGAASNTCAGSWTQAMVTGNGRMGVMVMGCDPAANPPRPQDETLILSHNRLYVPVASHEVVPDLGRFLPQIRQIIHTRGYGPAMAFAYAEARAQNFPGLTYTDPFLPAFELKVRMNGGGGEGGGTASQSIRTENFQTGEVSIRWSTNENSPGRGAESNAGRGTPEGDAGNGRGRGGPRGGTGEGSSFIRRIFVSRADNVAVMWIGPAEGQPSPPTISCELWAPPIPAVPVRTFLQNNPAAPPAQGAANALIQSTNETNAAGGGGIMLHNLYREGGGSGYDCAVRVAADGGSVESADQKISIKNARGILVLMRVEPFKQEAANSEHRLRESLDTLPADYQALLAAHVKIHRALFDRVSLDLHGGADRRLTTDQLLARANREPSPVLPHSPLPSGAKESAASQTPVALIEKLYEASRYQLICASGERPPNLLGIWSGTWAPAATLAGDFSLNANLQLSTASMMSGNLGDLMPGYFRWVDESLPDWQLNARNLFGARGVFAPWHQSNTGKCTQWSDMTPAGLCWTSGAAWVARSYWDYYLYTGDRKFLAERAVPFMKQVAAFYEDFLQPDETGRLRFSPSYSLDDAPGDNSTQEIMIARGLLTDLVCACRELGIEKQNAERWQEMLTRLPNYLVAPTGELQEWALPGVLNKSTHRHIPHLYGVFESQELDPDKEPELWKAARMAFDARLNQWFRPKPPAIPSTPAAPATAPVGGGIESPAPPPNPQPIHDRLQMALCAARFGEGEIVWEILSRIAAKNTYPSLMTQRYEDGKTFVADAAGAIPEILHRCLIWTQPGRIELLPALPSALSAGEIRGLLGRGQLTIHRLQWRTGMVECEFTSGQDQALCVRLPKTKRVTQCTVAGAAQAADAAPCAVRITVSANQKVTLRITFTE